MSPPAAFLVRGRELPDVEVLAGWGWRISNELGIRHPIGHSLARYIYGIGYFLLRRTVEPHVQRALLLLFLLIPLGVAYILGRRLFRHPDQLGDLGDVGDVA